MSRTGRWVLAVVAVQGALLGLYQLVEHRRASDGEARLGTEPPQRLDRAIVPLVVRRRDGSTVELSSAPTRPTIVHVWATWCAPCRAELPGLLALPAAYAIEVAAIALDRDWRDIDRFLGGFGQPRVFAAGEGAAEALGVTSLPVTFLLRDEGRTVLRFDGARDWTDEAFVEAYLEDTSELR